MTSNVSRGALVVWFGTPITVLVITLGWMIWVVMGG
jgi:hypothetical protein